MYSHSIDNEHQLLDDLQNHYFEHDEEVEFLMDDMILSQEQMDELFNPEIRRNAVSDEDKLWPNNTVPLFISDDFSKSPYTNRSNPNRKN